MRHAILTCSLALTFFQPSHGQELPSEPRKSKGELQRFDCSFVLEPGGKRNICDPAKFGHALSTFKTIAVAQGNVAPGLDGEKLREEAERLIREWKRFRIIDDLQKADFVVQVNMYTLNTVWDPATQKTELRPKPLPACTLDVWPRGANPDKDNNLLWLEPYWPKWFQEDSLVLKICVDRLRQDIEDAEKLRGK